MTTSTLPLNAIEQAFNDAGWYRGSEPLEWYAGSAGMMNPKMGIKVQVHSDRIRLYKSQFFGEQYSKRSFWDTVTVAVFDNFQAFSDYCQTEGEKAVALPSFSNSWD